MPIPDSLKVEMRRQAPVGVVRFALAFFSSMQAWLIRLWKGRQMHTSLTMMIILTFAVGFYLADLWTPAPDE